MVTNRHHLHRTNSHSTQGAGRRSRGACAAHVTFGRLFGLVIIFIVSAPAALFASAYVPPPSATSFAYLVSHAVTPLSDAVIGRTVDPDGIPFEYDAGDNFEHPPDKLVDPRVGAPRALSQNGVCTVIVSVARAYRLPIPFFANLIWQESNFNPRDISRAGAQGIAQFMPQTAVDYGLINPFEPIHAINVAARFLRELHGQFGNLGLAAAAYNAGPRRVINWMAKRGALPGETRNYVMRITGRPADRWTASDAASDPEMALMPAKAPCAEVAEAVVQQVKFVRVARLIKELADATKPPPPEPKIAAKSGAKLADAKPERGRKAARAEHERSGHKTAHRTKEESKVADNKPHRLTKRDAKVADTAKPARRLASAKSRHAHAHNARRTKIASSR